MTTFDHLHKINEAREAVRRAGMFDKAAAAEALMDAVGDALVSLAERIDDLERLAGVK